MIYELEIEDGKEKPVINFLKQLDFLTIKAVKKPLKKQPETKAKTKEVSYFGTCPEFDMDVKELRKKDTVRRLEGWL